MTKLFTLFTGILLSSSIFALQGLNVITTIDPKLQKIAINELRRGLENYDKRHGWRGPLENLGSNDIENLRIKYKNLPGLHDKIAVFILEINQNESK